MAMTKENKPKQEQATLKISHQMAKEAMESKIRAKVSKSSFFPTKTPLKIPVKCPTSFFEYMRLQAGMLGGEHAVQVSLRVVGQRFFKFNLSVTVKIHSFVVEWLQMQYFQTLHFICWKNLLGEWRMLGIPERIKSYGIFILIP